ncbi:hypothetical protein B0H13DRAFT_2285161 [Mycena leptocephala]|nr:hypothetical protein B0H13DRAFT_2285161 [Mycena leptocephala]
MANVLRFFIWTIYIFYYWDRADFSLSDLTTISDDEHSKLGFLEHEDGTLFDQDEARDTRAHARAAFLSLLLKHLAPVTWSQASSLAINWYRAEMSDDTNSDPSPQKKRKKDSSSVSTVSKNAKDGKALKKSKNRASTSVILPSVEIPTSVRSPSSPTSPNSTSVPPPARIPSPIPTSSPVQLLLSVNPNSVPPPARIPSPVIQVAPNIETVEKQSALPVAPLNPEIQGRENQSVTKIINPLLGIFGKEPQVRVSRLDNPETSEHVEGPLASAPSMSGPSISNAIAVAPPQVGNPVPKKAKCHKPGAADTAWNIFGREHMKSYPKHTTAEVKAQYDALDETAKKKYVEAGKLRKGKKLVNKGKEKEANPLESGAE